jgi:C4-dicarboxylate-specific signal transduction histidine kinase
MVVAAQDPTIAGTEVLTSPEALSATCTHLREQLTAMESRLRRSEDRRRAMLHIMADIHETNKRLANHRKAMIHILSDYESDRQRLMRQTQRLDDSRRAILHILQDSHRSNVRLERSRKAMIHIMGDLQDITTEMQQREQDLRDKQEQLVQAGKLATLGELTTGVAHELNNPLNNISLFLGNIVDQVELNQLDESRLKHNLQVAMQQVRKATEIISHLRTFGRVAPVNREPVAINEVIRRSLSLMHEQLRLREIAVELDLSPDDPVVNGSPIQLEQVFLNLLTNARDALSDSARKVIMVRTAVDQERLSVVFSDTGSGIPPEIQPRIFDPFFTTKEVGAGTGLGLSITYGIVQEHGGSIAVGTHPEGGAMFALQLPLANDTGPTPSQV